MDPIKLISSNDLFWKFRDSKHEYVLDWVTHIYQTPESPKFTSEKIRKQIINSTFTETTHLVQIGSTSKKTKFLKTTVNLDIFGDKYDYTFIFECEYTILDKNDVMIEKYDQLLELYKALENEKIVHSKTIDIFEFIVTHNEAGVRTKAKMKKFLCDEKTMLLYHEFLLNELKDGTYKSHLNWMKTNGNIPTQLKTIFDEKKDYNLMAFIAKYYIYNKITDDQYLDKERFIHDTTMAPYIDDQKLLIYIGIIFSYLSKYDKYDIVNFKIIRSDTRNENNEQIQKTKLMYEYKINNTRDYFHRYHIEESNLFRDLDSVALISTNNFVIKDINQENVNFYKRIKSGNNCIAQLNLYRETICL